MRKARRVFAHIITHAYPVQKIGSDLILNSIKMSLASAINQIIGRSDEAVVRGGWMPLMSAKTFWSAV